MSRSYHSEMRQHRLSVSLNNEDDMQNRPSLEERVKHYPKIQWLLSKYADKAYPIIDKHDIEAALTEVLDDMDKLKGAYHPEEENKEN